MDFFIKATEIINEKVSEAMREQGKCSIMLTGGRTAKSLYKTWAMQPPWEHTEITYYFGDERCVFPTHSESNFGMVISSLFPNGVPDGCNVERMRGEVADKSAEADRYAALLPKPIDILLLSVGSDGHIASLFQDNIASDGESKAVMSVTGSKQPYDRLTIMPRIIKSAKSIFVFAMGEEKGMILTKALNDPENIEDLPVRLTIGSTWILDRDAAKSFKITKKDNYFNTRIVYG